MSGTDVAIVMDHFGSGGVERVAVHVANGLAARGMQVEMVVLEASGPVRSLLSPAVKVTALGGPRGLPRGLRLLAAVPRLARHFAQTRPAIVHSPGNHMHVAAALASRLAGRSSAFVPKITNPILKHGMGATKRAVRSRFYAWVFREAPAIVVLSPPGLDDVARIAPECRARTRILHNPYIRIGGLGTVARRAADPPVILSVGRLAPQKDQGTLLEAAARLRDRPWTLRIFGKGPDEAALRARASALGIADRVVFGGFVDDLSPQYAEASVFALSSRWEELPAALIEAMASGCPAVTTASSPAIVAMLAQVGARPASPVGDVAALADSLRAALDGQVPPVDPASLRAYDIEAACEEHAALFAAVLGR